MTRVRVYISTTEAPAEVQRVAEEDPEIRSVICLDGKAVELPVSAAYDSFVRKPTGVIEAEFGHASYRVDVGARITEGLSWQLGIYLAHALARDGRLAVKGEPADRIVLATGEVDRDLHVRAVDHVADKCRVAEPLFAEAAATGATVVLFVPTANRSELPAAIEGCKVVPVDMVQDALAWLGVERLPRAAAASLDEAPVQSPPENMPVPAAETVPAPRRRGRGPLLVLAAIAAVLVGIGWWMVDLGVLEWRALAKAGEFEDLDTRLTAIETGECGPCQWLVAAFDRSLEAAAPETDSLAFGAVALTVPRFRTCRVAEFRPDLLERSRIPYIPLAGFAETTGRGLCALEYSVDNKGPDRHTLLMAAIRADNGEAVVRFSDPEYGLLPDGGSLSLDVQMPSRIARPMTVTLFLVVGDEPLERRAGWLEGIITEVAHGGNHNRHLTRRLARARLALVRAQHHIAPAPPRFQ